MDLGLRGKRALITGGSLGIGFGIAQSLAEEGAEVILASRNSDHLNVARDRLQAKLPSAVIHTLLLDMTREDSIRFAVSSELQRGPIDILINNVGGPPSGPMTSLSVAQWDTGYQSLVRSVIVMAEMVVPSMRQRQWGRILTVTSSAARQILPGLPVSAVFRSGLTAWAKHLAQEVGRDGVMVNNLLPGLTNTDRLKELHGKNPEAFAALSAEHPMGRVAEPCELGKVAAFVCSSANTYLTGIDILVDGGQTKAL